MKRTLRVSTDGILSYHDIIYKLPALFREAAEAKGWRVTFVGAVLRDLTTFNDYTAQCEVEEKRHWFYDGEVA